MFSWRYTRFKSRKGIGHPLLIFTFKCNNCISKFEDVTKANTTYNTHIVINNLGELVDTYQKIHLYDVDTPEFKFRESLIVNGGRAIVPPLKTPIGQLGLMIVTKSILCFLTKIT